MRAWMAITPDPNVVPVQTSAAWQEWMRPAPQGWQCPRCHKVYAPHVSECAHCNHSTSTTGVTTGSANIYTYPDDYPTSIIFEDKE